MSFQTDLTEGPVVKKYIFFMIPILLSGIIQQLYNTADTMVVGKFVGEGALAAVGSTASLTNLILNMFLGLSVGTNVVCSRLFGAGNKEDLHKAVHTSMLLAIVSGIILAVVGMVFSRKMLALMSTPDDVIDDATLYMKLYFLGSPTSMIYNFGAAILRAAGDTKRPLYILSFAGIANVGINLFCVIVLKWGVAGVAIGTIAAQLLSAILVLRLLVKTDTEFKLEFKKLKLYKKELTKIAVIGIPSGLNGIMFSISNVIIQSSINSFGKIAMAGSVASGNIESFGFLIINASVQGVVTFVGQNMGARKLKRVDNIVKIGMLSAFIGIGLFSALIFCFGEVLLGLFVKDATESGVIEIGMIKMIIAVSGYSLLIPCEIFGASLKGMGRAIENTIVSAICVCLLRVVWILAILPFNRTITMLFMAYPITWAISSVVMFFVFVVVRKKEFSKIRRLQAEAL